MSKKNIVLIVDDDPTNLDILNRHLTKEGYATDQAEDGSIAWDILERNPGKYTAVLLDRMMPNMDGIEVLKLIKRHETLKMLPVIMQTAKAATNEVLEGLREGAYYYLTKPFDRETLLAIVKTAVSDYSKYMSLLEIMKRAVGSFTLMKKGHYEFRSLGEADTLATLLANACPKPGKAVLGLSELLVNAVEHGNLGITYEDKSKLSADEMLGSEIERRMKLPEYKGKVVTFLFERANGEIRFHIKDQGEGFNWKEYLEISPERAFDIHGRGIAMSRGMSFDHIEYNDKGNEVTAVILY